MSKLKPYQKRSLEGAKNIGCSASSGTFVCSGVNPEEVHVGNLQRASQVTSVLDECREFMARIREDEFGIASGLGAKAETSQSNNVKGLLEEIYEKAVALRDQLMLTSKSISTDVPTQRVKNA